MLDVEGVVSNKIEVAMDEKKKYSLYQKIVFSDNFFISFITSLVTRYNPYLYWKFRKIVINPKNSTPPILKMLMLVYIKRTDAFWNCSLGTGLNSGATFKSRPNLEHGLNGIIIGHDAVIGSNVTIYQRVTISQYGCVIGDNCVIGANATILSGVKVGNNVKIGANCVVVEDVPDGATVVLQKPRIIERKF